MTGVCCVSAIKYSLTLDSLRAKSRAAFVNIDEKSERKAQATAKIIDNLCVEHLFAMKASKSFLTQPGPHGERERERGRRESGGR